MYVAMTRARQTLRLSHAETRLVNGVPMPQTPSRFLGEVPDELIAAPRAPWHSWQPDLPDEVALHPGCRVVHAAYGSGVVLSLAGAGIQARARVRFSDGIERHLLLEYAKLVPMPGDDE